MLRKQARERREYLYRKAVELQESSLTAKRQQLKLALASGKPLSKELSEDQELQKNFIYDESIQDQVDDEYSALSGISEPKVIVTTSRDPSTKLSQFAKEMKLIFPTGIRLNRGTAKVNELVGSCQNASVTDLVILHERRGVPNTLTISHMPHGPTLIFTLDNVVLRHDILNAGNQSELYPHLIFENFTSKLGKRVETILKNMFPPGVKKDSPRVITFINNEDFISVRQHVYVRTKDGVEISEIGPRFEMKLHMITLGTLENADADIEWQTRRYVRTAARKEYLAE